MLTAFLGLLLTLSANELEGPEALLQASYHDDLASAERLLRAGANVNAANDLGATPLWAACQNGSDAMVRRLLEAGADPNAKLLVGETPLMVAARSGYASVVEQLLAKGADPNVQAARGQTALMWAASQKHPAVVKALLAKGADVHVRSQSWTNMMAVPPHGYRDYNRQIPHGNDTALLFAARSGDLESAKLLIAAGAKVNDQDAWGITPLVFAAHSGFGELVKFLLSKDADPNLAAAGFAAIHIAIIRRDEAMSAALLAHGANPNLPLRTWTPIRRSSHDWYFHPSLVGATPVWLAARFTLPGVMRLLVERGADPRFIHQAHSVVERGFKKKAETTTTVMAALGVGSTGAAWVPTPGAGRESLILETVKLAVEHGADVNAANTDGRTALAAAKTLGYETVVRYLVEKGAK